MELFEKVREYINTKNGHYIELGAHNGIFQSNTKFLEDDFGWNGVLIEPSKNMFEELKFNRPNNKLYNSACVSFEFKGKTITGDFNGGAMSSVGGKRRGSSVKISVNANTLTSLLDDSGIKSFNFLSLDVEGYELEVLKGLDFKKYPIDWVLIEIYDKDKEIIIDFMAKNGYDMLCNLSGYNYDEYPRWDGTHNDYLFKKERLL